MTIYVDQLKEKTLGTFKNSSGFPAAIIQFFVCKLDDVFVQKKLNSGLAKQRLQSIERILVGKIKSIWKKPILLVEINNGSKTNLTKPSCNSTNYQKLANKQKCTSPFVKRKFL